MSIPITILGVFIHLKQRDIITCDTVLAYQNPPPVTKGDKKLSLDNREIGLLVLG